MISVLIDSNNGFADVLSRILEDVSHRCRSPPLSQGNLPAAGDS